MDVAPEKRPLPYGEKRVNCTLYTHSDFSTKNYRKVGALSLSSEEWAGRAELVTRERTRKGMGFI
tara:strand:- start:225 stop:419 length:195 start_codon:yes stop_codon:yes gene_type:complete